MLTTLTGAPVTRKVNVMAGSTDPPCQEHGERGVGPLTRARARAIAMARAGAGDDQVMAGLRAEFCAGAPGGPRSVMQRQELERSFRRWVASGVLDDARVAGELAVQEALQEVAETGTGKDQVAAASLLLRHRTDDIPGHLRKLLAKLREMDPDELQAHVAKVMGAK